MSYLFLLSLFFQQASRHDFKMSVCEIVYAAENQSFGVSFYLFKDDLGSAIYGQSPQNITAEAACDYVLKRFSLSVDGAAQALRFRAIQEKNDQVLVQFDTPKISVHTISGIKVRNTLLVEKFASQANMVYVFYPDETNKQTKIFNTANTSAEFSF